MAKRDKWATTAPRIIYDSYPDQDLLPIEPPKPGETIAEFKLRAEDAGDTLFLFLCREADDEIDADEYIARLDRAMRDIEAVQDAFGDDPHATLPDGAKSPPDNVTDQRAAAQDAPIRLMLGADWIELTVLPANAQGQRAGSVTSSLHESSPDDDLFNAAMDAIKSLVLGHACAGIDVTDPRYLEGIRTCLDACANHL